MRHRFDLGYKTWVHYGELALPSLPPVIDNTRQPQMSNMTALLNDLSYIPVNNEHNEPTQEDIGETSNEPTQATCNEFEEFYASANEELYPGCDYVTRLDFMEKLTYFKVNGNLTDSIFNEMLEFFQNLFPISKGYKLPPSYYAIKKTFKTIGLGYESIHACEHDCCLFQGDDNKYLDFCPVCNTSIWKDSNTPGKKVPKKVLCYFPIIPRLQRLYKSSHSAKEMVWHATGKCTEPGKMQHPVDGTATLTPSLQHVAGDIDEIEFASVVMYEREFFYADFNMRAMVLWTINDFPAQSSLSGWSGQGYKACATCNKDTPFVRLLSKTTYVSHKRFLKKLHKWWSSREFNGQTDNRDPPKEFGEDEILAQLDRLPTRLTDTVKSRQDLQRLGIRSGLWLGQSKNGKCLKPQAAYSLTPENRKKFCRFIKGVKLPDGFRSCFKNKIAKPIIELCSLFKQICSATLMEDNMLKAQIKVVDILCDLELIYTPALFDIMIHLVIHLPLEALEGGPIRPRWMYPFERYMKKLKGYVQNKAKPEGSIAEGYVAEEALTFKFPDWFGSQIRQHYVDNDKDPEVSTTNELFALACEPTWTSISINSCVVDGVRYVVHSRDERRITQNSGICLPGPDGEMYYGQLQEILEFKYLLFKVMLFRVKWFDTRNKGHKAKPYWRVVEHVNHKKFSDGGVIVVEDDPDIIYFDNSSDLPLSTSLNDLDNATLHIDGQSTEVDVPPDIIIDVVDEDDDITDDEDALPYNLIESDNEDLINVDDDGVNKVYFSEEED
nr:hypothetical protein [Tanacetum cinerariifolium]